MKRINSVILLTATLLSSFAVQAERTMSFTPPQLGAPNARVGGGTRGILNKSHQVAAVGQVQLLAANKTGLSSLSSPTLYWYASSVPAYDVELTIQQGNNKPLLKKNIGAIKTSGIQTIRLADYGVNLVEGEDYTWSVALIADPKQRSADLLIDATVRYQKSAAPMTDVAQMTTAGYWYDAVSELVEKKSPKLQELLLQEGISIAD
jgi:hypothetical protein